MVVIRVPYFEDDRSICIGARTSSSTAPAAEFQDGKRGLGQSTNSGNSPAGFATAKTSRSSSCGCHSLCCFGRCEKIPSCTAGRTMFANESPSRRSYSRGFQNINSLQLTFISTPSVPSNDTGLGLGDRTHSTLVKYNPELVAQALASLGKHVSTNACGKCGQARASFCVNVIPMKGEDVSVLMPKLPHGDYYTKPSIKELEARERAEPGYCSHVKNLVVGRRGKGSVKFLRKVDIRQLDLGSIIQFNEGEVIVYMDGTKKPPVGQGLNQPAEITLLNVKCIDKLTGQQQYMGRSQLLPFVKRLSEQAAEIGVDCFKYDQRRGEWKFKVQHF